MTKKNDTAILILALLITAGLLGVFYWWWVNNQPRSNPGADIFKINLDNSQKQISLGNKILIAADTNSSKQDGVEAFAKGDFQNAKTKFQQALLQNRNDPEALIYLNNASIAKYNPIKIAVSIPIGGNLNVAKEMLRGVAQAQSEAIRDNKLNIQVVIANDDNNSTTSKQVAREFVNDKSILAVVGHNSSDATLAAVPEYQNGKLVMISPTSDAKALSGIGSYIFRTSLSLPLQAEALTNYAITNARKTNLVICVDAKAEASQSLKNELAATFVQKGGKVAPINCDVSDPTFNANAIVSQAIIQGADSILLLPSIDRLNQGIDVAQANQRRLALFSSSVMYTIQTLQQGQASLNGMVMVAAWHPQALSGKAFAANAVKLWGGEVNWRSATAYDATEAIITGLQASKTREGLQQVLSKPDFVANGATGSVAFLPTGDRKATPIFVQVQPGAISKTGFDFVPLKP